MFIIGVILASFLYAFYHVQMQGRAYFNILSYITIVYESILGPLAEKVPGAVA
jgi:hypothetical protein